METAVRGRDRAQLWSPDRRPQRRAAHGRRLAARGRGAGPDRSAASSRCWRASSSRVARRSWSTTMPPGSRCCATWRGSVWSGLLARTDGEVETHAERAHRSLQGALPAPHRERARAPAAAHQLRRASPPGDRPAAQRRRLQPLRAARSRSPPGRAGDPPGLRRGREPRASVARGEAGARAARPRRSICCSRRRPRPTWC